MGLRAIRKQVALDEGIDPMLMDEVPDLTSIKKKSNIVDATIPVVEAVGAAIAERERAMKTSVARYIEEQEARLVVERRVRNEDASYAKEVGVIDTSLTQAFQKVDDLAGSLERARANQAPSKTERYEYDDSEEELIDLTGTHQDEVNGILHRLRAARNAIAELRNDFLSVVGDLEGFHQKAEAEGLTLNEYAVALFCERLKGINQSLGNLAEEAKNSLPNGMQNSVKILEAQALVEKGEVAFMTVLAHAEMQFKATALQEQGAAVKKRLSRLKRKEI